MATIEEIKSIVPKNHRSSINQEFVDMLNDCGNDGELSQTFKDNFLSYVSVLQDGRYKITDYLNAVKYVSYKMLGKSSAKAWELTFPDRYNRVINDGVKDISPYASAYNSNKLVTQITQQTLVPLYVLNNHMGQEALNALYTVMKDPRTKDRDRINACVAVLDAVKQPESANLNIDVNIKDTSFLESINDSLSQLATQQLKLLESGKLTATQIIEAEIIPMGVSDV